MSQPKYNQCYGISRVRRASKDEPYSQFLVWRQSGQDRWKKLGWRTRQQVVHALEGGVTYITLRQDTRWLRLIEGEPIHVVDAQSGKFLRTDWNDVEGDLLDDLPEQTTFT